MQTKLSQLQDLIAEGNWEKALAFAAKFQRLGEYRNAILDAHLACTNPRWIVCLGKDVEVVKALGIVALKAAYGT